MAEQNLAKLEEIYIEREEVKSRICHIATKEERCLLLGHSLPPGELARFILGYEHNKDIGNSKKSYT